jgi:hypothetical protein
MGTRLSAILRCKCWNKTEPLFYDCSRCFYVYTHESPLEDNLVNDELEDMCKETVAA